MKFIPFSIILFFILTIFSCSNEPRMDASTLVELNNILDKNIEIQRDRFYKIHTDIRDDLYKPEKYKYTSLLHAALNTVVKYDNFIETYQLKIDTIHQFHSDADFKYKEDFLIKYSKELSLIDQLMVATFDSLLTEKHKIIGLEYDEMQKRLKEIRKDLSELNSNLIPDISNDIKRNDVFNLKLKSIKYAAVHKAHFFIERFREFASGKVHCGPNFIFPLIQTKTNIVKKGEYFEAKIFVGDIYTFYPTDEPKIIVNGDTLDFDVKKSEVNLKYLAKERGEEILKMELLLFNRLTGERYSRNNEYVLNVD